jgi:hypothetical protein
LWAEVFLPWGFVAHSVLRTAEELRRKESLPCAAPPRSTPRLKAKILSA